MLSVKQYQINLNFLNFNCGVPDGICGNRTKQAIQNFQSYYGLISDGIYGNQTNYKLIEVIKDIQRKIGCTLIDGMVGSETISKCKEYQEKNNLVPDGICGEKTRACLNNMSSWNNIKHFKKEEFTCKCGCGFNIINIRLVEILENIREHFNNNPIIITSGCRCPKHNAEVGGVSNSYHTKGSAADFTIPNVNMQQVLNYCNELVTKGILRYAYTNNNNMKNTIHIDIG